MGVPRYDRRFHIVVFRYRRLGSGAIMTGEPDVRPVPGLTRPMIETEIERLIGILDWLDPDPDLELECEDEGAQCDDEGAQMDCSGANNGTSNYQGYCGPIAFRQGGVT